MLKTILIISGIIFFVFVSYIVSLFMRVGKPVDAAISDSYYHHRWKNKIIYSPMGNWFELGYQELEADVSTFTPVHDEYSKDKTHVFYKGQVLKDANPATFRFDYANHIATDGNLKFRDGVLME